MRASVVFLVLVSFVLVFSCGSDQNKNSNTSKPKVVVKKEESTSKKSNTKKTEEASSEETEGAVASDPIPKEQLDKAKSLIKSAKLDGIDAKRLFKIHCTACHGIKGNLMINGAKDLTKSEVSLEESVAQVYFGKGLMTPFKGILKDNEIVAVAKYSETLRK